MGARRSGVGLLAVFCALAGVLLFSSAPAFAVRAHVFSKTFGEPCTTPCGNSQFNEPVGVAVNDSTGDVYVVDKGNNRVEYFTASGGYLGQFNGSGLLLGEGSGFPLGVFPGQFSSPEAIAVDNACQLHTPKLTEFTTLTCHDFDPSNGDVYVADTGHDVVDKFSATGTYEGQLTAFKELHGVAVDSEGNVWVYENEAAGEGEVAEFSDTGTFVNAFNTEHGAAPGFTVDSNDNIYLLFGRAQLGKYNSTFTQLAAPETEAIEGGTALAVNLNPLLSNLFVDKGSEILEYGPFGEPFSAPVETLTTVGLSESHGVAVNGADGTVYATEREADRVAIFNEVVLPKVTTGSASNVRPTTATLNGTVNPDGVQITSCQFEYGTAAGVYTSTVECSPKAPFSGVSPVAVSASLTGLTPSVAYHFRLVAGNANGPNQGSDQEVTTPTPPSIDSASAGMPTSTSADLVAKINPDHADTTYRFEYGTSTSYEASTPEVDIGSGASDQTVTQHVTGLHPNTTYHFRVVAQNVAGTTTGHDDTFVYDTAGEGLPDGRAYEMVTPVQKAGSSVEALPATVAADGSSLAGDSRGAFAGVSNAEIPPLGSVFYRFTRTASGWTTAPLQIPRGDVHSIGVEDSLWAPANLGFEVDHLSLREADGSVSDIGPVWLPALGPDPTESGSSYIIQGAAREASHGVVFTIGQETLLWPYDETVKAGNQNIPSLYEYVGTNNSEPTLVGVGGDPGSTTLIGQCGTELGASQHVREGSKYNAISESGQSVFFTAEADSTSLSLTSTSTWASTSTCASGGKTGTAPPADELYARLGGSQTVWVSEPQCTRSAPACENVSIDQYETKAESEAAGVVFEGASADGSKVFFTTTQQLTNGDTDATRDLYECELVETEGEKTCDLTDISAGGVGDATPGAGADVEGVSRISEDGSHVYFVANGVLTTSPSPDAQGYNAHGAQVSSGAVAQAGGENLYVYDTETHQTAFIAELCSGPEASGGMADPYCPSNLNSNPWGYGSGSANDQVLWSHGSEGGDERPLQSTPDGHFLVFPSYGDLTADDTSTARQVFQYDAQTGGLVRVSVGQDGFDNDGNTTAGRESPTSADTTNASIVTQPYDETGVTAGFTRGGAIARTMSDDGSYVFFQSPVGLTSQALNDVPIDSKGDLAQNVYEYHDGRVSLISDGKDTSLIKQENGESGVSLIGTDASGSDVFFTTVDPLVPQDTDTQLDIYDARIGGGFPAAAAPSECQGETCQGVQGPPSSLGAPASATFSGAGNLAPPSSPKPKAKAKPLTRAQKLAKALQACAKKPKKKRRDCKSRARNRYGHTARAKKSDRSGK